LVILTTYDFKSVVLHTKDYALFYGARFNKGIEAGLEFAIYWQLTTARESEKMESQDVPGYILFTRSVTRNTFQQQSQNSVMNRYLVVSPAKYLSESGMYDRAWRYVCCRFQILFLTTCYDADCQYH
jgi:hypothetical protein